MQLEQRVEIDDLRSRRLVQLFMGHYLLQIKDGGECDLLRRLAACPAFGMSLPELESLLDPAAYVGRCPQQVEAFLSQVLPSLDGISESGASLSV